MNGAAPARVNPVQRVTTLIERVQSCERAHSERLPQESSGQSRDNRASSGSIASAHARYPAVDK